ncbi:hypothetical protein GGF50DRAFT_119598 [Schizophyllum commune]
MDKSFPTQAKPALPQAVQQTGVKVDALELAARCHEDALNIDPGVFDGTEEERQDRQVQAIAKLFEKFNYEDVMLNMFSDVPQYLRDEANKWKTQDAKDARYKAASDRKTNRRLRNQERSQGRKILRPFRMGVETVRASPGGLDATKLRVTSTGWQGINVNRLEEGAAIRYLHANDPAALAQLIRGFRRVPYTDSMRLTIITDCKNRAIIVRCMVPQGMIGEPLTQLEQETSSFFVRCDEPFSEAIMGRNARGPHYFSIIGVHRNNLENADFAEFDKNNAKAITWFFREDGPMRQFDAEVGTLMRTQFPSIVKRIESAAQKNKEMFGAHIRPKYGRRFGDEDGVFYNFCANAPRPFAGIPRVHCAPHVDHKNLAVCVCVILIYGHFNHRERCWLVIWEAGLIIELPSGVMLAYPSSLFFHWNVDVCDLDKAEILVTKDGQRPDQAKGNAEPLNAEEKWEKAHGRGSMVWFNQATMFQSAELGVKTIKAAKARGMDATCNHRSMVEGGYFPQVAPTSEPSSSHDVDPSGTAQDRGVEGATTEVGLQAHEQAVEEDPSFGDEDLFEGVVEEETFGEEGELSDGLGLGLGGMGLSSGSEDVDTMDFSSE